MPALEGDVMSERPGGPEPESTRGLARPDEDAYPDERPLTAVEGRRLGESLLDRYDFGETEPASALRIDLLIAGDSPSAR